MPRMILSLAPASALLSGSVGWRGRDSSSVAATQLPRTRRLADRRALRSTSRQAPAVGVGPVLNELASNTRAPGCSTSSLLITGSIGLCAGDPGKRGSRLTAVGYSRVRGKTVCGIREDQGHGDGGA